MDIVDMALRAIGAFYLLAGAFAARAALTSNLIDQAIAAISMKKTDRVEKHRTFWLLALSILFFAGGVCLVLLLEPAAWLFAISALIQIFFFLVLGPYYFDVADPPPPAARQRSINAFVVYGAATLFTIWAAYTGHLTKLQDASPLLWGAALAAIALHIGYILRHTLAPPKRKPNFAVFDNTGDEMDTTDAPDDTGGDIANSRRIKLMADYGCYPLWAMDEDKIGNFSPYYLYVSLELENDLWAWASEYDMSLNADDPANSNWSEERHHEHIEDGLSLARRIKQELPDREVFALNTDGVLIEITAGASPPR
jgi:hypothetical protein